MYALSLYLSSHEAKDGWKNLSAKIGVWSLVLQEKKCNFATIILLNSNSYTSQIKDDIMTVEITIVGIRKYLQMARMIILSCLRDYLLEVPCI